MVELIGKGAEADLILEKDILRKVRIPKTYRLKELDDEIRKRRTRSEAKIMQKVGSIGPGFIESNDIDELRMSFIPGLLLKEVLDKNVSLAEKIGSRVGALHDLNVVHGDLTTSNMLLFNDDIKIIDFGLSFVSDKVEDKAVDLHLFKEAVESKHYLVEDSVWDLFVKGYNPKNKFDILKRLEIVRSRGRNKEKY